MLLMTIPKDFKWKSVPTIIFEKIAKNIKEKSKINK
jgi:hypothetical protein